LGDEDHAGASSPPSSFTVVRRASSISISLSPPIAKEGDRVTISGGITPPHSGASVTIQLSKNGSPWSTLTSTPSSSAGTYSYGWDLTSAGVYTVRASWEGDRDHEGATSSTITVVVGKTSQAVEVPLPHGGPCKVPASSNSSTLSLRVNANASRISINVTGPGGTTGILAIFISDELLREYNSTIGDFVFTIDGREVVPQIVSVAGGYLITLTYSHNTHTIDIYYVTHQIVVRVLDHEGMPVSATVVVNITGPVERAAKTNESGIAVFTKVPAGKYVITAFEIGKSGGATLEVGGPQSFDLHTSIGRLQAEYQELRQEYDRLKMLFVAYTAVSLMAVAVLAVLFLRARKIRVAVPTEAQKAETKAQASVSLGKQEKTQ
jgi:hypothetical protein